MSRNKKKTSKSSRPARWWRIVWLTALKLGLVVLLALVVYFIYLDSKITSTFSGQKWQVPAQIYGRSLALFPGKYLTQANLILELEQLQYRRSNEVTGPGQFSVNGGSVTLFRRSFTFVDGEQSAERFSVEFNRTGISRIVQQGKSLDFAQLEPQLIEHLVSPHQEDRELVRLELVPELLKETLLLVEDRDFYQHRGVSPLAILRAFGVNLVAGRTVQGGSTLTQQLAKNMYLTHDRTLWRKVNEAFIALVLDFRFSKDQILEAYLNEIYLGQNHATAVHGFGLASRFYFGKPLAELAPEQYALLIGVVKGPGYYDPRRFPERAQRRRDLVLRLMFEQHLLDRPAFEQAINKPMQLVPRGQYLNASFPAYMDAVKRELRQLALDPKLMHSGIKVFTYLDPMAQTQAERTVSQLVPEMNKELEAAMLVVDYQQAAIQALVGGKTAGYAGFNRALEARRPIGSLIKPPIYLEALAQRGRFTLGTLLDDSPISLRNNNQDWQPQNFDKQFRGPVSLMRALADSRNLPTVRLGLQLGMPKVQDALRRLGLERRVNLFPAALLGAVDLSPYEVTQLYQTIANNGVHQQLAAVQAVTDQHGAVVYQRASPKSQRYPAEDVYLLHYAMIESTLTGTAQSLARTWPQPTFAGKTGTSSDYRDSWFAGFDQDTLVTVWLGRDDNKSTGLTGGTGALRVFADYFRQRGKHNLIRYMPEQVEWQRFSTNSGLPVPEYCPNSWLLPAHKATMLQLAACD
ncbi:penicillin-binding protein 1B [Alishewanella longhuensis]|uniref:Penicillin-binding protein 1B n=1 Tax=Alishewanella longhuensis TaxID=1091037 RepID=A0ABQ3L508_9ALTE|nr:penicillin-binding protein 1B [Alishewanella longhuensis]GHG65498.1 penicillin-binding protein 1B [Alishewanella longhuensis]